MNNHDESLLTIRELSERMRISIASVYALIKDGKIIALRVGVRRGAIRVRECDLAIYLNSCVQEANIVEPVKAEKQARLKHISIKPK